MVNIDVSTCRFTIKHNKEHVCIHVDNRLPRHIVLKTVNLFAIYLNV